MSSKTKNIIQWILTGLICFVFISSGMMKLIEGEETAKMIKNLGGASHVMILGVLEFILVALFLIPRTGVVGSLLMIAYMGGALAVHYVRGQPIGTLVGIQILIWVTSVLKFPELGQRLFSKI
jgi:DoxX-like family